MLGLMWLAIASASAEEVGAIAPSEAELAAVELSRATALLAAGQAEQALQVAILGVALYPAHAKGFEAVANMALAAIERGRGVPSATPIAGTPTPGTPTPGLAPAPTVAVGRPAPAPAVYAGKKVNPNYRAGFDLGMPLGVRAEWMVGERVDAVGVRLGGGVFLYEGGWFTPDMQVYLDIAGTGDWQFEVGVGTALYFLEAYPNLGFAAQFDPTGPFQLNLGMKLGSQFSVMPDISVGLMF